MCNEVIGNRACATWLETLERSWHPALEQGCQTLNMTRKILTALVAIGLMLFVFPAPNSAQERRVGNRTATETTSQNTKAVVDAVQAEKLRRDLIVAYEEMDSMLRFLAGFGFLRESMAMDGHETALRKLEIERKRVEQISISEFMAHADNWPNPKLIDQLIETARSVRTDAKFHEAVRKAEQYSSLTEQSRNTSSKRAANSRSVVAAPAYLAPICNFNDPSNYPSGTDIAISNGVALGLHALADALPGIIGIFVALDNPARTVLVIAAYAVDQVTNALKAVASDAEYCEAMILYIEDNLVHDEGHLALLITNDFYLSYMYRTVKAAITKATNNSIPTNCGSTRLMEAAAFFDASDNYTGTGAQRMTAFQKLRAAYQNIGAASCIQ